jgi:alkylation response protein AidB-like acyl-CoA dehydrogenase
MLIPPPFLPDHLRFRDEVRAFFERVLTPDLRDAFAHQVGVFAAGETRRRWHAILYEQGWIAPAWPREYGGTGWDVVQRYIFETESFRANIPFLPAMGIRMCGPIIIRFGSEAQKSFFLPRILSGEHYWCQGYSEPQAGSDLASLQCRAVRDADDYVINGSKIWTTHAQSANWIFLLARTSTEGKPQAGISFLLVPMDSPGITVRPIIGISGEHELNEVFFDDVRVPVENRVGAENEGWSLGKALLEFERGRAYAPQAAAMLERVKDAAVRRKGPLGDPLPHDPQFAARFAWIEIRLAALDAAEQGVIFGLSAGESAGKVWPSILKLQGSEMLQAISELGMEAIGSYSIADQAAAIAGEDAAIGSGDALTPTARYLNLRAATIYGGSSETQKNIIARIALGL